MRAVWRRLAASVLGALAAVGAMGLFGVVFARRCVRAQLCPTSPHRQGPRHADQRRYHRRGPHRQRSEDPVLAIGPREEGGRAAPVDRDAGRSDHGPVHGRSVRPAIVHDVASRRRRHGDRQLRGPGVRDAVRRLGRGAPWGRRHHGQSRRLDRSGESRRATEPHLRAGPLRRCQGHGRLDASDPVGRDGASIARPGRVSRVRPTPTRATARATTAKRSGRAATAKNSRSAPAARRPRQVHSGEQTDEAERGERGHRQRVGTLWRRQPGDEDRAGDCGAEGRAEVGHAARQAGDLTLQLLGEARLHDVDRRREHQAEAEADEEQPGANAQALGEPFTIASSTPTPAIVRTKPARMRVRCGVPLSEPLRGERGGQYPHRCGGEDDAGLDRVVAANDLQVGRDHE